MKLFYSMYSLIAFFSVVLVVGLSLDSFGRCKNGSFDDPDPYDPFTTQVGCYGNERFSCWENNDIKSGYAIGERICAAFKSNEGSWYNEVPLLPEAFLDVLNANGFQFTEDNYKTGWQRYLPEWKDSDTWKVCSKVKPLWSSLYLR